MRGNSAKLASRTSGTATRARHSHSGADVRRAARPQPQRRRHHADGATRDRAFTDGANALRIGYAEPVEDIGPDRFGPSSRRRARPHGADPVPEPLSAAPPLPVTVPRASFLFLVLGVVVTGVLGVLVLNTKINENAFRLDELRNRQAALDLREQQLSQDLDERESPGNLAAAAKRLGLVPAGPLAFINLPDGRIVGVPQPASGQPSTTATTANGAGR